MAFGPTCKSILVKPMCEKYGNEKIAIFYRFYVSCLKLRFYPLIICLNFDIFSSNKPPNSYLLCQEYLHNISKLPFSTIPLATYPLIDPLIFWTFFQYLWIKQITDHRRFWSDHGKMVPELQHNKWTGCRNPVNRWYEGNLIWLL